MLLPTRRPILCLVTDRQRMGGASATDDIRLLVDLIAAAGQAGVDLVQIRELGLTDHTLVDLVSRAVAVADATPTRIVVNDRPDVALAAGAAGVHLKSDSIAAGRVRSVGPEGWLIGQSVHGLDGARAIAASGNADYLVLGTVYATAAKPGRQPLGLETVRQISQAVTLPILAIGGITVERAASVARVGVAGVAAVGLFAEAIGVAVQDEMAVRVRAVRQAFDKGRLLV